MGFWDLEDGFKFESFWSITTPQYTDDAVIVRYVTMTNQWITIDTSNRISFWDLVQRERIDTISNPILKGGIVDLIEVTHLQMIAIAS